MRDRLEAACRVEARSEFVGECLILDEAARACRADRLFVEAHGIEVATFDARDLGGHQGGAVLEILRTILCPYLELSMMRGQSLDMPLILVGRCRIPGCRAGEGPVEVILRRFEQRPRCPQQPLRPR